MADPPPCLVDVVGLLKLQDLIGRRLDDVAPGGGSMLYNELKCWIPASVFHGAARRYGALTVELVQFLGFNVFAYNAETRAALQFTLPQRFKGSDLRISRHPLRDTARRDKADDRCRQRKGKGASTDCAAAVDNQAAQLGKFAVERVNDLVVGELGASASSVQLQFMMRGEHPELYKSVVEGEFEGKFHVFLEAHGIFTFMYSSQEINAILEDSGAPKAMNPLCDSELRCTLSPNRHATALADVRWMRLMPAHLERWDEAFVMCKARAACYVTATPHQTVKVQQRIASECAMQEATAAVPFCRRFSKTYLRRRALPLMDCAPPVLG